MNYIPLVLGQYKSSGSAGKAIFNWCSGLTRRRPRNSPLTAQKVYSLFVLMSIETLGEAYEQGWQVRVRCAWGPRDGMKRVRECVHGAELDLQTLVWTRGAAFPLARMESRLKCPQCGSRRVVLLFEPPSTRGRMVGVG